MVAHAQAKTWELGVTLAGCPSWHDQQGYKEAATSASANLCGLDCTYDN